MSNYNHFAKVYDLLMEDVPYAKWANNIVTFLEKHQVTNKIIADIGCGTGNISMLLADKGYEVIGVDNSMDMLMVAREKAKNKEKDILFLQQDMRELELFGSAACILSLCDSMNYITEKEDILKIFKRVKKYLDEDGLFIFDMNTEYYFSRVLGDNNFSRTYDNSAYIWENYYYEEEKINEYNLTLFVEEDSAYSRHEELHYERAYDPKDIIALINEATLKFVGIYDVDTLEKPTEESTRIYYVVKKN